MYSLELHKLMEQGWRGREGMEGKDGKGGGGREWMEREGEGLMEGKGRD